MNNTDKTYLELLGDILKNGTDKKTRSGEVRSVFGRHVRFNLREGLPVLTVKKMFTKGVIEELLWFLRGETNIKTLVENGVHIWDDDAYRHYKTLLGKYEPDKTPKLKEDFLKNVLNEDEITFCNSLSNGPVYYKFGDLGPVYGKQWRDFSGIDQIRDIIDTLKNNPHDRRILCIAYNPSVLSEVALPPCHILFQFYTRELSPIDRITRAGLYDKWAENSKEDFGEFADRHNLPKYELSCMWTQRSVDSAIGLPFNITSYAIMTYIIAKVTNMEVGELIGSLGDTHIYKNHFDGVYTMLSRDIEDLHAPTLKLKVYDDKEDPIRWIESLKLDDFVIEDYNPLGVVKMPLSVG